jgi:hypothetical protein
MAYAQRLADQVKVMFARVQQLEHALAQATGENKSHPLLSVDSAEFENWWDSSLTNVSDAIGSLSIGSDGRAKYHGETAGSEVNPPSPKSATFVLSRINPANNPPVSSGTPSFSQFALLSSRPDW